MTFCKKKKNSIKSFLKKKKVCHAKSRSFHRAEQESLAVASVYDI